jgi:hypothetical protein
MSNSISYHPGIPSSSASAVGGSLLAAGDCSALRYQINQNLEYLDVYRNQLRRLRGESHALLDQVPVEWDEVSLITADIRQITSDARSLSNRVSRDIGEYAQRCPDSSPEEVRRWRERLREIEGGLNFTLEGFLVRLENALQRAESALRILEPIGTLAAVIRNLMSPQPAY